MECAQCGEPNRESARFCSGCGTALAQRCTNCQAELRPTAKFCDECGTSVGNAPSAPAAPAAATSVTATRKIVTALFADLVGSTSFGERTDAEVARVVMARYHALLQDAIDAHGGTVAKFMGDGMMATFGIPEIAEDDALRAVRAGADIQRRFTHFAADIERQHGETLGLRVGVNSGEVVIASGDADLVGDALNVAARIEHACRPGNVTVGEETWRLTRGEFGYESLGEVTVAGRAQAVAIYEVVAGGTVEVETAAPFVGRAPEMAALRRAFDAATASHSARLVTVLGSPGVGKTRLSRELCAAVAADSGAITVELRCDRAGDATFAPIAQLIREATGLGDDSDAASARERLGTLLAEDAPDRERLVDVFAGLVGAAPSRSVEETFWAVRRLVSASAGDRPMVVVIDDIQWAEPLFLDLLEHLAEWVQDVPFLLVCLARPELRDIRPSLAERGRRVEDVLALDGLDSAATAALAAGLLGTDHLPAGLVERLPTSTDGNPLFVRELVRMLVDDEVIRRVDGEWELAIDADAVEVPPTIQSLLAARVERLPSDERTVLELASVIGAEFSLGALRELAPAGTQLPTLLEAMRRKELVEPTGTYWGDEPVHRFHHVLIRDSAYRRLLKTTRADLHERVAVWTDTAATGLIGEHESVIAYHYEQAFRYRGELGSIDEHVDALGRRAAELLATAADRALGRDDLAAAGALARRALALLPASDTTARAALLLIGCECLLSSGDVAGARPLVEALKTIAGPDPTLGAWASCFEAQLVGLTDPEGLVGAEATATGAAKVMEELGDGAGEAKAHQVRAGLLARLGRVGDAELELDLALGAARRVDDRRRVTAVLGTAPVAALWGPSPVARAGGRCLDVVRLLRITTASPSVEATSMRCQAVLEALRGRFDVARSMLESSRTTLEELGLRHGLLETQYLAGVVELVAGDAAAAIDPLRDAYDGLSAMGVGIDAGRAAALLARALLAEGDVDGAAPMAAASEALAGQDLKTSIAWRVARAEVLAARGDVAAGVTLAEEAVQIAAATDLIIDHADACVALAALRATAADATGARSARAEARRLYDLKGATVPSERLTDDAAPTPTAPAPNTTPPRAPLPTTSPPRPERDGTDPRHPRAENAVTRPLARLVELVRAGHIDQAGELIADGFVRDDRRSVVSMPTATGRDEYLAAVRAIFDAGFSEISYEPLAVRGDRLMLVGAVFRSDGGNESSFLQIDEVDGTGRFVRMTHFDPDALADALAELDARYLAGEGAAHAQMLTVAHAAAQAAETEQFDVLQNLLSPDFEYVDHRPIGFGDTGDADLLVAGYRSIDDVGLTTASDIFRTVHCSGRAFLAVRSIQRATGSGSEYDWTYAQLMVIETSGRISRIETFAPEDWAIALARFDELGPAEPADPRHPRAENRASHVLARYEQLVSERRYDDAAALYADDLVATDRRTGVSAPPLGPVDLQEGVRLTFDVFDGFDSVNVAVRGDRLVLSKLVLRTHDGLEVPFLQLFEIDDSDRIRSTTHFDEDALAEAQAELDARYLAGDGAPHARLLRAALRSLNAGRIWDHDAMAATMSPDFAYVDHRPIGFGQGDAELVLAVIRTNVGLVAAHSNVMRTVFVSANALLSVMDATGVTDHGLVYGRVSCIVATINADELVSRTEWFTEDDFPAALARLDELGAANPIDPRHPRAENLASQRLAEIVDLAHARDRAATRALLTNDFVRLDRRRGVAAWDAHGPDEWVAALDAWFDVGMERLSVEPIAVRGEQLLLARVELSNATGAVVPFLGVWETDASGRFVRGVHFDDDALDDALTELNDRFIAGEGAPYASILDAGRRVNAASNAPGRHGLTSLLSDDFVAVDHRQLSWPTLDRDEFVAAQQSYEDQISEHLLTRSVHLRDRAVLGTVEDTGIDAEGGSVEWVFHLLTVFDADQRVERFEFFDEADFAAALARLDELGVAEPADPRHPRAENRASRRSAQMVDVAIAHDRAGSRALLADDFVRLDRRRIVAAPDTYGPDEYLATLDAWFDVGMERMSVEPIAVRGEQLVLVRIQLASAEGAVVSALGVWETDSSDRFVRAVHFDEDALAEAQAELDERYLAGEGAPHARVLTIGWALSLAGLDLDADAMRALLSPDLVAVDHQRLGFGAGDRDSYLANVPVSEELARPVREILRTGFVVGNALLGVQESIRTDAHGGEFEWLAYVVMTVDASDRVDRIEWFDVGDWAAALARLDELGSGSPERSAARLENTTTRTGERLVALVNEDRFEDLAALIAPEFVNHDRRTTVSWGTHGRETFLTGVRATREVGLTAELGEVIAIRGDRLSLRRLAQRTDAGDEIADLMVSEVDADGRLQVLVTIDDDRLPDAIAELDARYLAGEGAADAAVLRPSMDHIAAFNRRDWAALLATMQPDIAIGDHRGLWPPESDRAAYLARMQSLAETTPNSVVISRRFLVAGNASLATYGARGTSEHGGRYDYDFHVVARVVDGRFPGFEFFADDDFPAALARLDELSTTPVAPAVENAVTRLDLGNTVTEVIDRYLRQCAAGEFGIDGIGAEGLVRYDRRRGVSTPTLQGLAEFEANMRAIFEVFETFTTEPIAIRGDRVALIRVHLAREGFATSMLGVYETDEQGLLTRGTSFDEDDFATAVQELDARDRAGDGAEHADMLDWMAAVGRAMREREPGAATVRAFMAPGFELVDHRTLGYGAIDLPTLITLQDARDDQVTDDRKYHRTREVKGNAALAWYDTTASAPDGGQFTWSHWVVWHRVAGLWARLEMFDLDDETAARARFEELSVADHPTARPPEVENQLTRTLYESLVRIAKVEVEAVDLVAEDVVIRDHRAGVSGGTIAGRDAFVANAGAHLDVFAHVRPTVLAVRGEHLALIQMEFETDGFTSIRLNLFETNDAGQLVALGVFDETDFGRALDELDERFIAGEGAEHEHLIRRTQDFVRSLAQLDGAATLGLLDPEIEFVDHRPLGLGTTGIDGVRSILATRAEQVAEDVSHFRTLSVRGDAVMGYLDSRGVDSHGIAILYEMYWVSRFAAGKVVWNGWYDRDDHAAALAKFEELAAETRTPYIDNACVRALVRAEWLVQYGDLSAAVDTIAEDIVSVDRRKGVAGLRIVGRDDYVTNQIEVRRLLHDVRHEWLAVRGERLALSLATWTSEGGDEVVHYATFEIDAAGRLCHNDQYSDDNLTGAYAALEARWAEIRIDDPSPVERAGAALRDAFRRRDRDASAACFAPDFATVDHRTLGFGTANRAEFLERRRAMAEVIPDSSQIFTKQYSQGHADILVVYLAGTTAEGNEYEWHYVSVMVADERDLISRMEYFSDDQWPDALARFDELAAEDDAATPPMENTAVRTWASIIDARATGDPARAVELVAPDVVGIDRRAGVSVPDLVGREALAENAAAIEELFGVASRSFDVVARRGDRLALLRARVTNTEGFGIEGLLVVEVTENGQLSRSVYFDDTDLLAALTELDARHLTLGRVPAVEASLLAGVNTLNRRDWDRFTDSLHPDFVAVDHSPLGFPLTDRDGFVNDQMRGMAELVPDFVVVLSEIHSRGRATLAQGRTLGTTAEGNEYAWHFAQVFLAAADGRGLRRELFADSQWAEALARFDELAAEDTPVLENRATAAGQRARDAALRDDREATLDAFAPDFTRTDDRPRALGLGRLAGREIYVDGMLAGPDAGMSHFDTRALEIVGDDHALIHVVWGNGEGFGQEWLIVSEVNRDGHLSRIVNFEPEDRAAASALLHEWAAAPVLTNRMIESSAVRMDALARGDRDAVLATYAPEFVRDDRRRGVNFGTSNREETVDALLAGNNVGLGNRDFTTMEVIGDNFALGEFRMSHDDGFELVYLLAAEQDDDGRLRRATNFDLEDRDQASALLSEWAAERDGNAQPPTNAMTRTLETFPAVYAAGDWDEFAAGYADPAMVVDDRRAGVSAGIVPGRDAVMELVHGLHDVGFQKVTNVPMAVRGEGLALFRRVWHNPEGFDLPMLVLVEAAPSGLVGYQIMWDVEDLDTAMAELDRRFAEVETWSTNLSNAATRILAPYPEKFAARDWEWIGDMIDEHAVSDDRRTAVSGGVVIGRPAIVKLTQGLEDVGFTTMSEQPIAIRGDRLVLTIRTWHDPHGFDLPLLALMEFTDAGPMISNIMWDLEDLDTAYAEMDRLYLDGEGAPHAEVLDPLCYRFIHCYNTRDWAALATPPFGPDTVLVDHRPASYGEMLGIDQLVEYLETMLGLVPDLTVRATEIPAVSATGTVFRMLGNGHTADGGEVEFEVLNCTVIVDGVVRSETFSGDQLDVAIARFTELTNGG